MGEEIKISTEVERLVAVEGYRGRKNRVRISLEILKNEIRDLMNEDVKNRNWLIMTEEEFDINHQENIANNRCSLVVAAKTGHWQKNFLFAEGTEL